MMAAAAASSLDFRFRQSRSRTARRLSASRLVKRSSSSTTGIAVRLFNASMKRATCGVCPDGVPSSRVGMPTTIADNPSSSPASRAISFATRSGPSSSPTVSAASGRASVRVASLIASPIRRRPTSMPRMRTKLNVIISWRKTPVKPAAAVLLVLLPGALFAGQLPDRERTEALAARAAQRLQALHDEADRLATEERSLLRDLRQLELSRQIRTAELRQSDADAKQAAAELAAIDAEIRRLEQQEQAEAPELRARLTELYKLGQGRYLRMVLSISDARRLGAAARMVAALARRDRDRLAAHQRRRESLTASRTKLNERAVGLNALRADAEKAQAAADRAVEARNAIIKGIDRQRDLNAQLAGEL